MIYTSGDNQNSYLTVDDANALLLTMAPSFVEAGDPTQLAVGDEALLIEAAQDLETLWSWNGHPTSPAQALQWPRRHVPRPGWEQPREPGWGCPVDYSAWGARGWLDPFLAYKVDFLTPGLSCVPFVDENTVPAQVRQAQALLALLRKCGKNLVGDDQGDTQGLQLDTGFKIAYVNAVRVSSDIHKRLAGLGWFIGDPLVRSHG